MQRRFDCYAWRN